MKTFPRALLIIVVLGGLSPALGGCGRTREEKLYIETVRKTPLAFTLPESESDAAWARAQKFIARYSLNKIKIATDYVLQTEDPTHW